MSYIILDDEHDAKIRLKSFSTRSGAAGRTSVSITLETSDAYELGYLLQKLAQAQAGQRARPKPEPKPKRLALPKPDAPAG